MSMSDLYEAFLTQLRLDLRGPLPGREAQMRMAPLPRPTVENPYDQVRPDARRSGVLVLFYPHQHEIFLPLILRPTYDGVHSGQVGFPGGGYEPGDADLTITALREADEEIGIVADQLTLLGQLSPLYVFASNFLVYPTVAWSPQRPEFNVDPYEVAQLLEVSLRDLLDPANYRQEEWQLRGRIAQVPFFYVLGQNIWGATAMMLSELLALPAMRRAPGVQQPSDEIGD
jgi:8-oxo-dGTP pyrophosphatase MutT (NUDIX family)